MVKILPWNHLRVMWSAARMWVATQMETHWSTQLPTLTLRFCANSSARWGSSYIAVKLTISQRFTTVWLWRWSICGIHQKKSLISSHFPPRWGIIAVSTPGSMNRALSFPESASTLRPAMTENLVQVKRPFFFLTISELFYHLVRLILLNGDLHQIVTLPLQPAVPPSTQLLPSPRSSQSWTVKNSVCFPSVTIKPWQPPSRTVLPL